MKTSINPIKGKTLISLNEFNSIIKNKFGLTIDLETICKYIDTFPQNQKFYTLPNPSVFTVDFKDEIGKSWANIEGVFYKNHTSKKTKLFEEFKYFKEKHTFKIGKYFFI